MSELDEVLELVKKALLGLQDGGCFCHDCQVFGADPHPDYCTNAAEALRLLMVLQKAEETK